MSKPILAGIITFIITVIVFTLALCKASGQADKREELLRARQKNKEEGY